MRIIYEVSRHNARGDPPTPGEDDICSIAYATVEGWRFHRVAVPCATIGKYRVGDEYVESSPPNIPGAVNELRLAVEDLFRFVDLARFPTDHYQASVKQEVAQHLTTCRTYLGIE